MRLCIDYMHIQPKALSVPVKKRLHSIKAQLEYYEYLLTRKISTQKYIVPSTEYNFLVCDKFRDK